MAFELGLDEREVVPHMLPESQAWWKNMSSEDRKTFLRFVQQLFGEAIDEVTDGSITPASYAHPDDRTNYAKLVARFLDRSFNDGLLEEQHKLH